MYSGRHPWDENDPYPDDDYDECDHMDYETDILTGFATCVCGHRWVQSEEELQHAREAQIAYDRDCERWAREERSLANRFRGLMERLRAMWRKPAPTDEIPF